jgi:hypothetical protein
MPNASTMSPIASEQVHPHRLPRIRQPHEHVDPVAVGIHRLHRAQPGARPPLRRIERLRLVLALARERANGGGYLALDPAPQRPFRRHRRPAVRPGDPPHPPIAGGEGRRAGSQPVGGQGFPGFRVAFGPVRRAAILRREPREPVDAREPGNLRAPVPERRGRYLRFMRGRADRGGLGKAGLAIAFDLLQHVKAAGALVFPALRKPLETLPEGRREFLARPARGRGIAVHQYEPHLRGMGKQADMVLSPRPPSRHLS